MRGHTLLELLVVLSLIAVGTGLLLPGARGWRDRAAVLSARESVAALIVDARSAAVRRGRGAVVFKATPSRAWTTGVDSVASVVELESGLGVILRIGGGRDSAQVSYGPLGLGRFANQTLEFRRGAATTRLTVSGYGRIRRD